MWSDIGSAEFMSFLGRVTDLSPTLTQTSRPGNENDAYSSSAILAEIFASLKGTSVDVHDMNISGCNLMQSIGYNDDCQELWGLAITTSCALSIIYSRATILSILRNATDDLGGEESMISSQIRNVICSPQCVLMFVDLLKLVRFRGPLPHRTFRTAVTSCKDVCDELDRVLRPTFSLLLMKLKTKTEPLKNKTSEKEVSVEKRETPLFLSVLVDEALSQFTRASSRKYDRMLWISRPTP